MIQLSNGILATGHWDIKIRLWDTNNNFAFVKFLIGHTQSVLSLTQLSNGLLVSGSSYLLTWDPNNDYREVKMLDSPTSYIKQYFSLLQLSNGILVAGGGVSIPGKVLEMDSIIKLYDFSPPNIKINSKETTHIKEIYKIGRISDSTFVSVSEDKICLNEEKDEDNALQSVICRNTNNNIADILALNETTFITSYLNGTISYWDLENFNPFYFRHISEIKGTPNRVIDESYVKKLDQLNSGELVAFLNNTLIIFILNKSNLDYISDTDHFATFYGLIDIFKINANVVMNVYKNGRIEYYTHKLYLNKVKFEELIELKYTLNQEDSKNTT
jgi:WD40 repeat protein